MNRKVEEYNENNLLGLKTGDIIRARVIRLPFIAHIGIVVVEDSNVMVYHNTPKRYNHAGGSIHLNNIDDWLKTREILEIIHTDMSADYIRNMTKDNFERKFDLFRFNCEHYAYLLKDGKPKSPQLRKWLIATGAILL